MRTDALKKTRLFGSYIGADTNLVAEMMLIGRVHQISKMLFFRRAHSQSYTDKNYGSLQEKLDWWKISSPTKISFPYWRTCLEYFKSIRHTTLKWYKRQLCYVEIGKWLLKEGWLLMSLDIAYSVFQHFPASKRFSSFWNHLLRPFKPD